MTRSFMTSLILLFLSNFQYGSCTPVQCTQVVGHIVMACHINVKLESFPRKKFGVLLFDLSLFVDGHVPPHTISYITYHTCIMYLL